MSNVHPTPQKPRSFRTGRALSALILREISSTYGRTSFGFLWAIVEPAAAILLLTLVFSVTVRTPGLGTSFALYYASGLLPFIAYSEISTKVAQSLRFSKPLLAFPVITFVDPFLARVLLGATVHMIIAMIVFTVIILGFGLDVILNFPLLLLGYAMSFSLAFGVGLMNSFLFMKFPFWERLWGIVTRPLFFVSCIFFLFETVPDPYRDFLWYNPLVHVVGMVRQGIYATYEPTYVSIVYVFGIAMCLITLGFLLLRRHYRDLLHR